MVEALLVDGGRVAGVRCRGGVEYRARAVVLTTGTFLQALMHTGEAKTAGGRAGDAVGRGALGQPPRRSASSSGASRRARRPGSTAGRSTSRRLEPQPGDAEPVAVLVPDRPDRRSRSSIATSPTPTRPSTT